MKKQLQLLIAATLCIAPVVLRAQAPIPNGDFEQWNGNTPVDWGVNNIGTNYDPISQTSDAHSGTAFKGTVVSVAGVENLPPIAYAGTSASNPGFPFTDHPNSITGFYKFSPNGGDSVIITCLFVKNGTGIGAGAFGSAQTVGSYIAFAGPIYWEGSDAPDSAEIGIQIINPNGPVNLGSTVYIDDLAFSNQSVGGDAVTPSELSSFHLAQNYPNPLAHAISTTISYSLDESGYTTLAVYDINGRIVATPVLEVQSAGNHLVTLDCSELPTGIYTYRLTCGDHSSAKMLQVLH